MQKTGNLILNLNEILINKKIIGQFTVKKGKKNNLN